MANRAVECLSLSTLGGRNGATEREHGGPRGSSNGQLLLQEPLPSSIWSVFVQDDLGEWVVSSKVEQRGSSSRGSRFRALLTSRRPLFLDCDFRREDAKSLVTLCEAMGLDVLGPLRSRWDSWGLLARQGDVYRNATLRTSSHLSDKSGGRRGQACEDSWRSGSSVNGVQSSAMDAGWSERPSGCWVGGGPAVVWHFELGGRVRCRIRRGASSRRAPTGRRSGHASRLGPTMACGRSGARCRRRGPSPSPASCPRRLPATGRRDRVGLMEYGSSDHVADYRTARSRSLPAEHWADAGGEDVVGHDDHRRQ